MLTPEIYFVLFEGSQIDGYWRVDTLPKLRTDEVRTNWKAAQADALARNSDGLRGNKLGNRLRRIARDKIKKKNIEIFRNGRQD